MTHGRREANRAQNDRRAGRSQESRSQAARRALNAWVGANKQEGHLKRGGRRVARRATRRDGTEQPMKRALRKQECAEPTGRLVVRRVLSRQEGDERPGARFKFLGRRPGGRQVAMTDQREVLVVINFVSSNLR